MAEFHNGGCHCGAVRYRISGPVRGVFYCHCSQCRKQSGHYYAASNCADTDIEIEGEDNLTWYSGTEAARRGFCSTCGSAMFWKRNGSEVISVLAGSFDHPSGLKAEKHIFVADKGDYYSINDGLPQLATY